MTKEYGSGTVKRVVEAVGYGARVLVGARRCCGWGVVPPERLSPLRVCSDLNNNALMGSVPSSLSALINLEEVCVPAYTIGVSACAADGGADRLGSAPSARRAAQLLVHAGCIMGAVWLEA